MRSRFYFVCAALLALASNFGAAVDFSSEKDYDSEFDDEIDVIQDQENLDVDINSDAFDLRSLVTQEDDVTDEFVKDDDDRELEELFYERFQEDIEERTKKMRITNLLHKIGKKYNVKQPYGKTGKCSAFKSHFFVTHNCTTEKTTLGEVIACRIACLTGYHLKNPLPHYELCGAPTKWRWTYQLRGHLRAGETCKRGTRKKSLPTACTDVHCVATAAYYMNKIDYKVDPCDNFFDYSCGRWLKETRYAPDMHGKLMTYSIIRTRVKKDMAKLLEKPVKESEISSVKKAKIVYRSCMNTELINKLDSKPLLDFLKGHMAWPVISKTWKDTMFDLESTLAALRGKYHNNILFTVRVGKNFGNYILQTWKGKTGLPVRYFVEGRYANRKAAYFSLMKDIAVMLGADEETARKDMEKVLSFEQEIAILKATERDSWTEKTILEMNDEIPGIDWLKLFKKMIQTVPITSNTKVAVWNVRYLRDMINIVSTTDNRVVQNYMVWRIVRHRIRNIAQRFEKRFLKFEHEMYGTRALHKRWYKCALYLIHSMQEPTGKMFADSYFSLSKKKTAEDMFNNIRNGFIHLLNTEVDWMDKKTKNYAKEKARAIKSYIGYNAKIYENTTYLDNLWESLVAKKNDYFGNVLRVLTQISQNEFKKLAETYDMFSRGESTTRPTMVNAFYSPRHNSITLPAGEMQYPFYWGDKFPRMFQYGGIGTILGHEITHGFDNHGAKRGIYGHRKDWWTTKSWNQFNKRTMCMANQYSNYYWDAAGEYLNGQKTLGENIADNGGIRESYQGYQFWLKKHNLTGEDIEPATGLTNNQMFFVGFANVRCAKYTFKAAEHEVATGVHSPGRFRVIGSLQNFGKFAEAFNCPSTSYMNPVKKCVIW